MSLTRYDLFNIWFPALVGALVIGLVAAALWDFVRRRFWLFVSRFCPSVLREVGLASRYQSRTEAEDHHREISEKLTIFARVMNLLVSPKSSNSGATTGAFDVEAQTEINPHHATPGICMTRTSAVERTYSITTSSENHMHPGETFQGVDCRPTNIIFTSFFPDGTSKDVTRPVKRLYERHANGPVKRIKSSIILQASIFIDPWVLVEIVELAKHCMQKENKCVFQLGNWAILYHNAGEVELHLLKEGDVPVNVDARWQDGKTGITMRGLYLTGSQVKVGTKRSSEILRSAGPTTQGAGGFDELHLPTGKFYVPQEDSLIYASKVVVVDGVSLIVRSEASFILPPRENNALIEAVWTRWLRISNSAKKMLRSLLFGAEDCQPERAANRPELESDPDKLKLSVEHWKGLSQIELLNTRREVLLRLQEQRASGIIEPAGPPSPHSHLIFVRDDHYLECWEEGLRVLNEVIHRNPNDSHSHTYIRVRGGIQFLLGDFESALQDYDLAHLNTGGHQSTVLLERALVKCMLGRYSEAMQDVVAVITLNPNVNDIQELETCIQQILHQQRAFQIVTKSRRSRQRPLLPDQDNSMVEIPDLLTGDEWHSGEIGSLRPISDAGTAGSSASDPPSNRAKSMGVARGADWSMTSMTSIAEALNLQLKLTNYAQSLEMNPRYYVRRISFIITLFEGECDPDGVVKPLSAEDQELLNWQAQARTGDLQNDLQVRETLVSLSRRLLPYKKISHTLFSNVTDDDSHVQRTGPHPLSRYRHVSCRSAMLTRHSAADEDVQTLFLYDGTAGIRSCWRRRSHDYIKLLVLPEARSPYRAFWLVQWDVVDMRQVRSDGQGDSNRGLCSNPATVEGKDINKKQFYGIRLSENRNSAWIAEVTGADASGLNRHRDARINPRMSIPANYKPQTSRQSSSDAEEVRAPYTAKKGGLKIEGGRRFGFKKLTIEIRPPKFKRKLWFGTYEPEDVDRAKDAINYYVGSNHFSDSPSTFATERGDPDRWLGDTDRGLSESSSRRAPRWLERVSQCSLAVDAEVSAAGTSSPTSDGNGLNRHRGSDARTNPRMSTPANYNPQTSRQIVPRSGRRPGTSQFHGVRCRRDHDKWAAEIRVAQWKAVYKKLWLGMFDTEQAAARAVDLARKLLKCSKKHRPNLPCEKLKAYSTTIPPHLILTDLTTQSTFNEITLFINHECKQYAASFNDSPSEQIIPDFRSPWISEVATAGTSSPTTDGNGPSRHRGSDARANLRMSIPVNEKPQTSRQTQPLRASGVDRVFPTISEIYGFGGDSTVDSSSMNAYERKSVDNFHYHNGDEEAMSEVLRSADANMGLSKETGLALRGEEESTFWYQFHCLQSEHATPRHEKGSTLKEWNRKDESQELKIENGLQVAVKRGNYHDLSRSIIEQESAVLAGITHPNICKPLHQITGVPATELMKHDLRSIIDSRLKGLPEGSTPFTWPVAVDIIFQIGEAMAYMHDRNVAHRDLKCQNILCTPLPLAESGSAFRPEYYYSVKLADFGLADSRIQSSDGETPMAGTSLFKAPEMLEVREFPLKVDVYSFGIVCSEILTGELPFEEYRNQGLSLRARRPLDNLNQRDVPEALKKLIHQCLNSNPALRPTFSHIVMKLMAIAGREAWDWNTTVRQSVRQSCAEKSPLAWLPKREDALS